MNPTLHLYYSWSLGYALLYDDDLSLVARAELEDDRHWFWRPRGEHWRRLLLPRDLPQCYLVYLARKGQEESRQ